MIFRLLSFIIHIPFVPPTTFSSQKRARRVLKDLAVDGIFICSWSWPFRQIYCVRAVPLRKTPNDYWEINSCFSDLKTFFFSIFVLSVFFILSRVFVASPVGVCESEAQNLFSQRSREKMKPINFVRSEILAVYVVLIIAQLATFWSSHNKCFFGLSVQTLRAHTLDSADPICRPSCPPIHQTIAQSRNFQAHRNEKFLLSALQIISELGGLLRLAELEIFGRS